MAKNIVMCCDGTCNEITAHSTNVFRLYRALVRDERQLGYYDGGVGTLIDPTVVSRFRKFLRKKLDAGIGYSLRDNVCEAYRFLAHHYEPGDSIFLFGFSRGAYTVRALAGMIHRLGLLRSELTGLAEYAWAIYSDELDELDDNYQFRGAARFKKTFGIDPNPSIHFVGAWDTVSSLGWIWDYRTLLNTAHNPSIDHIRHAVAIDERRACFPANLFRPRNAEQHQSFKEVWFPGVHSDVGGGYADEDGGLSKLSLKWMFREAEALGLRIDADERDEFLGSTGKYSAPDPCATLHHSLSGWWWLMELLPRRRWHGGKERMKWSAPNLWRRRPIPKGVRLHKSVLERMKQCNYAPPIPDKRDEEAEE